MATPSIWQDRALVATARLPAPATVRCIAVEVALRFADRFGRDDRGYLGLETTPLWQRRVASALDDLREAGLVREDGDAFAVTAAGTKRVAAAERRLKAAPPPVDDDADLGGPAAMAGVIATPLRDPAARARLGFDPDDPAIPVMAEVNLQYRAGPPDAFERLEELWEQVGDGRKPVRVAGRYLAGALTMGQVKRLVAADAVPIAWPERTIYHIWPDFPVHRHVDSSCVTIKADAARKSFEADGRKIVWAVIDTGIAPHPHFASYHTLDDPSVRDLHRFFPLDGEPTPEGALVDTAGHGTHVAGIIAGGIGPWLAEDEKREVYATESRFNVESASTPLRVPRTVDPALLAGMAPRACLVSLKAVGGFGGTSRDQVHRIIQALAYVREVNKGSVEAMRIHGVNISLGYEFEPEWFACGRSPLCQEVDRLVRSGVVVVVAAGNSGYGTLNADMAAPRKFGFAMSVNDPGNAELAITVGSTHRSSPHLYGVSYFSSKGPTGDGRDKPDLLAPGERITSCAAGASLDAVLGAGIEPPADRAVYVEDTGTSMAAPHVSGAVAALLSVRREFIGEPERVKRIFLDSAIDLGRRRDFQGAGLLDLMRALQIV
ncbi:subtilisin family serine protease [Actinoplanes tereljensis]|uniref:Peptidase S8 n=1 Tax=Paractinoplanes tereljensis TaxID=571912 RepID=A0A919TZD0_9ACTN|nr:S8 family peptidase [Actinoplanes tereljensis]GIF26135.1 peptidase S8 [Actinoplanes tereljensis]